MLIGAGTIAYGLWQQAEYERQSQHNRSKQASDTTNYIRQRCLGLPVLDKIDCTAKARDEYRTYQHDQHDLVAQRTSALWTALMGCAAIIGMFLSAVGVYLVWLTFAEQRKGNDVARQDAEDARKDASVAAAATAESLRLSELSAKAAVDQVRITQNTANKQLRPYIGFEFAQIAKGPIKRADNLMLAVKNFGQSNARDVTIWVGSIIRDRPLGGEKPELPRDCADIISLSPSQSYPIRSSFKEISEADWEDLRTNDRIALLVRFRVEYPYHGGRDFDDIVMVIDAYSLRTGHAGMLNRHQATKDRGTANGDE